MIIGIGNHPDSIAVTTAGDELVAVIAIENERVWVRDGVVDLAVANSAIVGAMYADARIGRESVRRLEKTVPFHNYTWAVQPGLPKEVVLRIRAFGFAEFRKSLTIEDGGEIDLDVGIAQLILVAEEP